MNPPVCICIKIQSLYVAPFDRPNVMPHSFSISRPSMRRISSSSSALFPQQYSSSTCNNKNKETSIKPELLEEPALFKLKKERNPDRLFQLFCANATNRLVVENRYAFEDTVTRLASAKRFDYIETLLEHQKALPHGRREGFVVRLILLYAKAGMIQHALDTFYDMHLYGSKRTVKAFNAALKVWADVFDPDATHSYRRDIPWSFGIEFDVISCNIIVNAFCRLRRFDQASLVMAEMEKKGVSPDTVTYTALISAVYKTGQFEIANGVWNRMVWKGCDPNGATFNARIHFLVCKGRGWEANYCMRLMDSSFL